MFQVTPIPAFDDNYIWALQVPGSTHTAVIDPGDATPVEHYLQRHGLTLSAILITHHHADHTGGVAQLTADSAIPVYGSHQSKFPGVTRPLKQGDSIDVLGQSLTITEVPGHTLDHISYHQPEGSGQVFCGDTLFLAGCGRLFEGSPGQMLAAMRYFRGLAASTEIYCTHEYSLANLAFAQAVEPENMAIQNSILECQHKRSDKLPTLPSTIAAELQINPFMRTDQEAVIKAAAHFDGSKGDETVIFTAIRAWKNQF